MILIINYHYNLIGALGRLVKTAATAAQGNQLSTLHPHYRNNPASLLIILQQSHLVKSLN